MSSGETFYSFFKRPKQDCNRYPYDNELRTLLSHDDKHEAQKYQNLFADVFSHHVHFYNTASPDIVVVPDSRERIVESDGLATYFLENLYTPPAFYETINFPPEEEPESSRSYDDFLFRIMENPITSQNEVDGTSGSNMVTFLIGEIGAGKSLLLCKTVRDVLKDQALGTTAQGQQKNTSHSRVVPIYFDFETRMKSGAEGGKLKDVDSDFYVELFDAIENIILQVSYAKQLIDTEKIKSLPAGTPIARLVSLIQYLHRVGLRLLLGRVNTI